METSSGIGYERDRELKRGSRQNARTFNLGVDRERAVWPVEFSEAMRHGDLVSGDLASLKEGKIVPLDPSLEFAGIIEKVGEDRGRYMASVITRCAIICKVEGLTPETCQGEKVFAVRGQRRDVLTLREEGTLIGEICAIENLDRGMAIVGIRLPADTRGLELGGPRSSR